MGIGGKNTAEIATITIGQMLGPIGLVLANLFAVLALMTSFIGLGFGLKEMYNQDLGITKTKSWILTCAVPALMVLFGITSFSKTLEITGAITGGLTGVLVVLMHSRAKKSGERKPEYAINITTIGKILLMTMFIVGAIFAIKELI